MVFQRFMVDWRRGWSQSAMGICVLCYIYVAGMEFRLSKRWRGLDAFIVFGDSGMDAGRCADEQ